MKALRLILLLLLLVTKASGQEIRWYPFDKDFVSSQYSNSAIGELRVKKFKAAATIHSEGGGMAQCHWKDFMKPATKVVYRFATEEERRSHLQDVHRRRNALMT